MLASALMDAPRFARDIESAFRTNVVNVLLRLNRGPPQCGTARPRLCSAGRSKLSVEGLPPLAEHSRGRLYDNIVAIRGATQHTGAVTQTDAVPVIELLGLSVRFGKREILRDLNISLSGRMVGLLGPNGAGKSTLIQTLLGFCPVSAGTARVLGHDISRERSRVRALVGYMPENDALIANMTAVSFVRMMGELSGLPPEAALERAHEVLFYVGLGEARYRPLGTYSLGMKQLAKLAQAIVHGPQVC